MEKWQQIDELFHAAAERAPHERAAFLAEACGADVELRREVESLLAADSAAGEMETAKLPAQVAAELLDNPASRIAAGQMLNQYRIVSPLGAGGMGEVFLAEDTRLKRKVALKLLPAQFTTDADRVRRFEQEAQAVSALNHPNIITLFDLGRADEQYFLTTEFIDGQTLRRRLRECGRLPVTEAINITLQICQALSAAHEAGIIHRDIKPENVMLRRDGYVKVLDFGLAKIGEGQLLSAGSAPSSLTDPGTVVGTASYMSPEQARGQRVDARTDIFSLGIVLYEMVAGRMPFEGANMFEVVAAILEREPAPLRNLDSEAPDELQGIVSRMLHKNPDQRYLSIREMLGELENLRDELKLAAKLSARQSFDAVAQAGDRLGQAAEAITDTNSNSSAKVILGEIKRHKRGVMVMLASLGLFITGGAFGIHKLLDNKADSVKPAFAALKVTPLITFTGLENKPSFSPDGKHLAFSWDGEKGDNIDIYIKEIDGEGMQRLTTSPAIESDAAWSPDGRSIAFFRFTGRSGAIFMMPSLGGVERKITDISPLRPPQLQRGEISWSPDGKTLAFSDRASLAEPMGIVLLTLETGERRTLIPPIPYSAGDLSPVFSPDGKNIIFNRSAGAEGDRDIYQIPVTGGAPRKITSVKTMLIDADWLPDGKGIVYSTFSGLWRVLFQDGAPEQLIGLEGNVMGVVSDRQRKRLAYIKGSYDFDIWRLSLNSGKSSQQPPSRFISSTQNEIAAKYSPDGRKIVFAKGELWLCDADGGNLVRLTNDKSDAGSADWSPDGRRIVYDNRLSGKAGIYMVNVDGRQRTWLTKDRFENVTPSWSRDGKWIYFASNRSGSLQIWKMPDGGGEAIQITKQGGFSPVESRDGKYVIYAKMPLAPGLWRVDNQTGEETLLTDIHNAGYWRSWEVTRQGVYFVTNESPQRSMIEFYDFATDKTTPVARLQTWIPPTVDGLSVSPDGRWIMYMQIQITSDIMLIDNVR